MAGNLGRMASVWRSSTPRRSAPRDDERTPASADPRTQGWLMAGARNRGVAPENDVSWSTAPAVRNSRENGGGAAALAAPVTRSGDRGGRGGGGSFDGPSEAEKAIADMWNRALRRELTQDEWSQLSEEQQNQVRFNSELLTAYDTDRTESPDQRRNTRAIYSQLGLDEDTTATINERLGLGIGSGAVRYGDLFAPGGRLDTSRGSTAAVPSADDTRRREMIASISSGISDYISELQKTSPERAAVTSQQLAQQYRFDNPAAKADYEFLFEDMLFPSALQMNTWASTREGLAQLGYDPEDFKTYVLDRIKLLPMTEGRSSLSDIQSWFG